MAAYTSTQSGNFSSAATWGGAGAPSVDGDTFNVTAGHTVTIDTSVSNPTNGFGDSNVYGILQSQLGQSVTLRMDGRLYIQSGGTLHLRAGATVEITGTSAEQHGIWGENATDVNIIMEGSDGMPSTTVAAGIYNIGTTMIPVASASNFAAGEWISIFDNQTANATSEYFGERFSDEGFWIHDIDGNNIYFRHFVGPEDVTITENLTGTNIIVLSNAKKFRVDDQIIFGTGTNRNIKTITAINYSNNNVTLDSSTTGSIVGEYLYKTGTEKPHLAGDKVRKIATVTTASASINSTQITVANPGLFSIGDEIWIERRSEADGTTDYQGWFSAGDYRNIIHTVSNVSGNIITLNAAIPYTTVQGALVTRLSRDVTLKCTTPQVDHAFLYLEFYSSNWNRTLILKDVYFKDWGNDDSTVYGGVVIRGYQSTNAPPVTLTETVPACGRGPWIEGIIVNNYPDQTHQTDWGPIWLYDTRCTVIRCSMTLHGDDGISQYYEPHNGTFNCITTAADSFGIRIEGMNAVCEHAYLYSSRNYYAMRIYFPYDAGAGIHNVISDASYHSLQLPGMHHGSLNMRNFKMTGIRYGIVDDNSHGFLHYSTHKFLSGLSNVEDGTGTPQSGSYRQGHARQLAGRPFKIVEYDFEYDNIRMYSFNMEMYYDLQENAWRVFRRYDSSDNPGVLERVYVPAGVSIKAKADIKLAPSFSGNYPILTCCDESYAPYQDPYGFGPTSRFYSDRADSAYTASAASDYETKEVTIAASKYPRTFLVGVYSNSSNAAEGFWIKNFQIMLDTAYANPGFNLLNNSTSIKNNGIIAEIGTTFGTKTRLGGRLS